MRHVPTPCLPHAQANKPLSEDTLNLWRGKRLNIAEMKIEARLHRLRNNPAAKTELQVTCSTRPPPPPHTHTHLSTTSHSPSAAYLRFCWWPACPVLAAPR